MSFNANPTDLESVLRALSQSSNGPQQSTQHLAPQTYQSYYQQQPLAYEGFVPQQQHPIPLPEQQQQFYEGAYHYPQHFSEDQYQQQSSVEQYDPNQPLMLNQGPFGSSHQSATERQRGARWGNLETQLRTTNSTPAPVQRLAHPEAPPSKPLADPSTIIDWKAGLRHVTELAARNEQLGQEIKRMIKTQHSHEREWKAGREALMQQQKERAETKSETDELLRKIGKETFGEDLSASTNPAADLAIFDRKVHRALQAMTKDLSAQLASLGVPFFGTKPSLYEDERHDAGAGEEGSGRMGVVELRELQRRMLRHLEDLFGE